MALGPDGLTENAFEAPIAAAYPVRARQERGRPRSYRSAPPCVTAGQLLRSALLILVVLIYADATKLGAWLTPPPPQSELDVDAATTPSAKSQNPLSNR